MSHGETPPNWLSHIVQVVRDKHRVLQLRQLNEIAAAIAEAPEGQAIKDHPG